MPWVFFDRPDSRARPKSVAFEDRLGAGQGWPSAQHRTAGRRDPRGSARRAAQGPRAHRLRPRALTQSALALIATFNAQIAELETALSEHFEQHPDAKVVLSLPGLGTVLGARVLGEFGDDRTRFSGPKSRKNYAGTSPVTKASGHSRGRPGPICPQPASGRRLRPMGLLCAHTSPGARSYYDQLRARGKTHRQALRQLANRLVGILHVCLERGILYDEFVAWPEDSELAA